ncbi:uncharacterized protein LOC110430565 [Sorghum bicolor]|uniref:uncharacterized protein LOC110430565 n=1 Tax=Sorghum bicolor TaxID=4558 RepID=UPI000B424058|nr:uncharacterized protein LOC110430565 [Sorghum bicolor]|eukprot:XP_021304035.1 uncharacterized protein LOC110430565 [Sorghum bicolor]
MRLITWNCRGLGNGPAIRGLLDIQKREAPDILFLSETKHNGKWLDWLRWKLEMLNLVTVDSVGTSGGLALFWRRGIEVEVKSFSKYHIDSVIKENDGIEWRFTGIYGESKNEDKDNTWEILRCLKEQFEMPWLCSGDFNEILFNFEKEGGQPRAESNMQKFRLALEDCDLQDLGFFGDPFTWRNNHHVATRYTKERLDRAVANSSWRYMFPMVRVTNGDPRHSDHRPIIIDVGCRQNMDCLQQMQIMPKFEAKWLEEEECEIRVTKAWGIAMEEGCNTMMQMQMKVLGDLWEWDRNILGDLEKRIKKVKSELDTCRRMSISQESVNREHLLHYKLERLQDQHNTYWKQRAHNSWLTKGDRNTSFFHAFASKRRRKNWIRSLKDENGFLVVGDQLKHFIANQYQQLFMSCAGSHADYVLNCVDPRVTTEMNESLMEPFTGEEIWNALESIGDLKAPGADEGLSAMLQKAEKEGKIEGIKI